MPAIATLGDRGTTHGADGSGPVADRGEADRARAVLLTLSG